MDSSEALQHLPEQVFLGRSPGESPRHWKCTAALAQVRWVAVHKAAPDSCAGVAAQSRGHRGIRRLTAFVAPEVSPELVLEVHVILRV